MIAWCSSMNQERMVTQAFNLKCCSGWMSFDWYPFPFITIWESKSFIFMQEQLVLSSKRHSFIALLGLQESMYMPSLWFALAKMYLISDAGSCSQIDMLCFHPLSIVPCSWHCSPISSQVPKPLWKGNRLRTITGILPFDCQKAKMTTAMPSISTP